MKQIHKMVLKVLCICMTFAFMASANVKADNYVLRDENPHRLEEVTGVNAEGEVYVIDENKAVFSSSKIMPVFNDNPEDPIKVVNFRRWADGTEVTDTTQYTEYLTGNSGYTYGRYGADAAYLGTYDGKVRFMLAGVVGEVDEKYVQIVNLADMAVFSLYRVDNNRLMHYVAQNMETAGWATQLDNGAAPSYLSSGKDYYSYDGHYFYTDYGKMLEDYKAGVRTNSVNPNSPYFNYYQYLPLRSQAAYSGDDLNTLLNNKINNTYSGDKASTSKMLNQGNAFVNQQDAYGVNALISAALAANESAWGTSSICQQKNNLFGLNAVDSSPGESADTFASPEACIKDFADGWMSRGYLYPNDWRYFGGYLGNKAGGINVKYASDPYWGEKAANHAYALDKSGGNKDSGTYTIAVKDPYPENTLTNRYDLNIRSKSSTSSTVLYTTGMSTGYSFLVRNIKTDNSFYQIQSDGVLKTDGSGVTKDTGLYDFDTMYAYAHSDYLKIVNAGKDVIVEHTYGTPAFNWSSDKSSCTAVFTCTKCSESKSVSCEVKKTSTASSCTEAGEVTYTATAIFKGKTYTDTKKETNAATGHKYGEPTFRWDTNSVNCVAVFTCTACKTGEEVSCDVQKTTTASSCTEAGKVVYTATVTWETKTYTDIKEETLSVVGHTYGAPVFEWADDYSSCDAEFACSVCGEEKIATCKVTTESTTDSCTEAGEYIHTASIIIDGSTYTDVQTESYEVKDHVYGNPTFDWAENKLSCYAVFACDNCSDEQEIKCEVRKKTTEATCTEDGKTVYTASVTFEEDSYTDSKTDKIAATGHQYENGLCVNCNMVQVVRVYGKSRYETSMEIADLKKASMGVDQFETILIVDGTNYPDALAGSYLADAEDAPILLTNSKDTNVTSLKTYISENLKASGKVYILGGTGAVGTNVESTLKNAGFTVERLSGDDRYNTNLAILKEAGIEDEKEILVATGTNFADSLSASAAKKPIMLVGKKLTEQQKNFLKENSGKTFCILGGENAVNAQVADLLSAYGKVERLSGADRYETSVKIANRYFENPSCAVFAVGNDFPDGLCGGPLAISMNAPLILTQSNAYKTAANYVADNDISGGVILGGPSLISDKVVRNILKLDSDYTITEWK